MHTAGIFSERTRKNNVKTLLILCSEHRIRSVDFMQI